MSPVLYNIATEAAKDSTTHLMSRSNATQENSKLPLPFFIVNGMIIVLCLVFFFYRSSHSYDFKPTGATSSVSNRARSRLDENDASSITEPPPVYSKVSERLPAYTRFEQHPVTMH